MSNQYTGNERDDNKRSFVADANGDAARNVVGTVALDPATLAALEEVNVNVITPDAATETTLSQVLSSVDGVEASLASIDANINVDLSTRASESTQLANGVLIGAVNESAPGTDTASSGLNGRLQRIAQRLTSILTALTDKTTWVKLTDGVTDAVIKASSSFVDITDTALVIGHSPFRYTNITTAATTVIKSGSGVLHAITINSTANGTLTVYDNTAPSGAIIALITTANSVALSHLIYDVQFNTGLTVVSSSANPDFTISWK